MQIIGVDLHTRQQTIAMLDTETGELIEKTLKHDGEEVRKFYSALPGRVLVGIEATVALGHGLRRGRSLWSQLGQHTIESLPLAPHAAHRRTELLALYRKLSTQIDELDERVMDHARHRPGATLLMTHPGVGPVTALATDVFLGDPARFDNGKALVSYVGMIPSEYSSAGRQRLGGLSKQGNPFLRFLWCEAAVHAVRRDPDLQRFYRRKLLQKGLGKARVAAARKLGIRLYIMLRDQIDYQEFCRRGQMRQKSGGACAGMPEVGHSPAIQ